MTAAARNRARQEWELDRDAAERARFEKAAPLLHRVRDFVQKKLTEEEDPKKRERLEFLLLWLGARRTELKGSEVDDVKRELRDIGCLKKRS